VTVMVTVYDLREKMAKRSGCGQHLRSNLNPRSLKSATNLAFMNGFWGEQSELNLNFPINYKWPPNKKHFAF